MLKEGFREFFTKIWTGHFFGDCLERWQQRLRVFRQKVRRWILNADAWYRKIKKDILNELDKIDKNAGKFELSAHDREEQKMLRAQLQRLVKQEEMKWLQRYKDREIRDGDNNSKYYHAKANGRKRKKNIFSLNQDEGVIEGEDNLINYITKFYKKTVR